MKTNFLIALALLAGTILTAAPVEKKNLHGWETWKRNKAQGGKVERIKANGEFSNGAMKIIGESHNPIYFINLYTHDAVGDKDKVKYVISIKCGDDADPEAFLTFGCKAKTAKRSWQPGFKFPTTIKAQVKPGETVKMEFTIDLAALANTDGIKFLCPSLTVNNLKKGSLWLNSLTVEKL